MLTRKHSSGTLNSSRPTGIMFCVTLKVLLFRYVYVLRQRWVLTVSYLLFPLIVCFLAVWFYGSIEIVKHGSRIEEHDERSLLRIPEKGGECTSRQNECQLKIVVCPDRAEEHQLMDRVVELFQLPDNTTALNVTYVNNPDQMTEIIVTSISSRGLHFHEITSTKLEYTIRPHAQYIPSIRYDWGDYATTRRFPSPMFRGPRLTDPYFNIINDDISLTGFLPLQVAIDKAYMETYFPNVSKEWILTSFPYPPYFEIKEHFRGALPHIFYLIFVQHMLMMGITFMISVFASYTINDKISGTQEWLCLNGAIRWMVNISWLVSFCFEATILAICEMVILKIPTINGPTIKYMSASVLTLVLTLYNWLSLCWVYLIATILKSKIICILLITAYWMFSPLLQWIPPDCFVKQGFLGTLPNAGLVLIFKAFQEFDGAETVLDFNRLKTHPIHYLPVGYLLLIMLVTSVLLILLSAYADLVRPGPYGRAKPWYLFSGEEKNMAADEDHEAPQNHGTYFEEISSKDPIGLECVRVFKFFRKRKIPWWHYVTAVKNVNMKIPKNKITVILGPNGAGKTALFSMLCGMYSPSSGHFYTEEYDVFHGDNIKKFRKVLGYCPQSNLLMNELTVKQHLIIFGLLKGFSQKEATENSEKWTKRFEMENFENTRSSNLSYGTKRKLCLAISMTGDHQYLLLDEPSSGLDAGSLRTFWNILLQEKDQCTVVLTTHNMDEAEVLGDYIALMVKGQLKAYGAISFLKQELETGYKLNITVVEKDRDRVVRSVRNFDNSISILYETHNTVTLGFPIGKSKAMVDLLKRLESEFGNGITTSITYVAMDDALQQFQKLETTKSPNYMNELEITAHDINRSSNYCAQITAIFKKRMEWIFNQSLMTTIILLLVIPVIAIYLTIYFTNKSIGIGSSSEIYTADLKLTLDVYNETIPFVARRRDGITSSLKEAMSANGMVRPQEIYIDMVDFLNLLAKKDLFEYRSKMVFAFDSGDNVSGISTAYYSRNTFHSAPIAYSALMNAILQGDGSITTHNSPYVKDNEGPSCLDISPTLISLYFKIILGPILLIAASYFVIFPHIERRTLFKHLQLMTGLLPCVYWLSNLLFDLLIFSITFLLIIVILAAKDIGIFLYSTVILAIIVVLLFYGISIIIFAYACSFCRCSTSIVVILFLTIPPLFLLGNIVLNAFLGINFSFLLHIENLYFLPWIILMESLQKISTWAGARRACHQCGDGEACELSTHSLFGSLKAELVGFAMISLVYFTFSLAMDHGFGRKLGPMIDRVFHGAIGENQGNINQDVENEKERVRYFEMNEDEDQPELICDGLGKKYSSKVTAVRDITFAHERGSVLGLLGTNGAGKSTLLEMLSAVISPTKGLAIVMGKWELSDCEYKYVRNIGYCPQFGGILPGLTGRDTLRLFGRLRGLKQSFLDSHVERWLQALDMLHLADRTCDQYSNGNKRKLSFAIAMIGFPSVVLLDEPTAGIDSVIRRRIWDILYLTWRHRSQAIILTSHAMSECEAICDRLAVLASGEMKWLGSILQLKNSFGKSCILHVKLKENTTSNQRNAVLRKIFKESQFSRFAKLEEKQINFLIINVKTENIKTYEVFADMMKIKDDSSAIDDFILSETPLEEAFVMSTQQNSSTTENHPIKKRTAPTQPRKARKPR